MGLEVGTYISDLVVTNPTITDKRREGDDHFRLLKSTIKSTFPNITGAVNPTQVELNYSVGVTSLLQTQLDAKLAIATADGAGLVESGGILAVGAGTGIVVNADDVQVEISGVAAIQGNALASTDGFLVDDAGTPKRMSYTQSGLRIVKDITTSRTLDATDMNAYLEMNNAGATSVVLDTGIGVPGNVILIEQFNAGQITVSGTATITGANGLKTNKRYSVIALVCKTANIWTLSGDAAA